MSALKSGAQNGAGQRHPVRRPKKAVFQTCENPFAADKNYARGGPGCLLFATSRGETTTENSTPSPPFLFTKRLRMTSSIDWSDQFFV